ncbi:hypothetical protein HYH03_009045 [Edaphochlamys debaryana]|uniref:Pherophorin domain-containing protein n=1 Tax=Edaphochlamys debaryana TaxID=47281 RepID=A0A835XZL0_9CHLO|nr:hypothetical protein HYH03_009045 [Edaphochlamys debaryana]|eukprot:KAG2492629.1 hypothetical protein HYH03_009045 [Edaphochlamys debaryana]
MMPPALPSGLPLPPRSPRPGGNATGGAETRVAPPAPLAPRVPPPPVEGSLYIARSCGNAGGGVGYVLGPHDDPLVPTFAAAYLGQAAPVEALAPDTAAVLLSDALWTELSGAPPSGGPADPRAAPTRAALSRRVKALPGSVTAVLLLPSAATDVSALVLALAGVPVSCALMDPHLGTPLSPPPAASWANKVASTPATLDVPDAAAVEWISCGSARAQALAAVTVGGASRPLAVSIGVAGGGTLRLISFNLLNVAPGAAAAALLAGVDSACAAPAARPPAPRPAPARSLAALPALQPAPAPASLAALSEGPLLLDAFAALAFPGLAPAADASAVVYDAASLFMSDTVLKQALAGPATGPALLRRVRRRPASHTTVFLGEALAGAAAALLQLLTGNGAAECALVQARSGRLVAGGGRPSWVEGILPASGTQLARLNATGGGGARAAVAQGLSCAAGGPAALVAVAVADVGGAGGVPLVVELRPYSGGGLLRLVPESLLLSHPGAVQAALTRGLTLRPCSTAPPGNPPPQRPQPALAPVPPAPEPPPPPPLPRGAPDLRYRYGACLSSVQQAPDGAGPVAAFMADHFPATTSTASLHTDTAALMMVDTALQGPGAPQSVALLTALNAYSRLRCGLTDPSTGGLLQPGPAFASAVRTEGAAALEGVEGVPGVACASPSARAEAVAGGTGAALVVVLPLETGAWLRLAPLSLLERAPADLAALVRAGNPACWGLPPPPPAPAPPRGLLTYLGMSGLDERPGRALIEGLGGGCVSCVLAANEDASFAAFVDSAFPDLRPLPSLGLESPALLLSTTGWELLSRFADRALLARLAAWAAQSRLTLAIPDSASAAAIAAALARLSGSDSLRCGLVDPRTGAAVTPRMAGADSAAAVPPRPGAVLLGGQAGARAVSCAPGATLPLAAAAVARVEGAGGGAVEVEVAVVVEVALPAGGTLRLVPARSLAVPEFAQALAAIIWGDAPGCSAAPGAGAGGRSPPAPDPDPVSDWTSGCVSYSDASGSGTAVLLPTGADPVAAAVAALLPSLPAAVAARSVGEVPNGASNVVVLDSELLALPPRPTRLLAAVAATPGRAVTVAVGPGATEESLGEVLRRLGLGRAACSVAAREREGAPSRLDCSLRAAMRVTCAREEAAGGHVVPIVTPTGGRVRLLPSAGLRAPGDDPARLAAAAALLAGYLPPLPPPPPPSPEPPLPPAPPAAPPPGLFPGWRAQACRPAFGACEARRGKNRVPYTIANGTSAVTSRVDGWREVLLDLPPLAAADPGAAEAAYAVMLMAAPECVGSAVTIALVTADGAGADGAQRPTPVAAHYATFQAPRSQAAPATDCATLKVPKLGLTPAQAAQPGNRLLMRFQPSAKCTSLTQLCRGYLEGQCMYAFTGPGYDYCPVHAFAFTPGS